MSDSTSISLTDEEKVSGNKETNVATVKLTEKLSSNLSLSISEDTNKDTAASVTVTI
jgi:lysophospholipid acyltransferase (LPLAT)-like uncharacterized protein